MSAPGRRTVIAGAAAAAATTTTVGTASGEHAAKAPAVKF